MIEMRISAATKAENDDGDQEFWRRFFNRELQPVGPVNERPKQVGGHDPRKNQHGQLFNQPGIDALIRKFVHQYEHQCEQSPSAKLEQPVISVSFLASYRNHQNYRFEGRSPSIWD